MPLQHALRAVLGHAEAQLRVLRVELIEPRAVLLDVAHVPAEVVVVAQHVGDVVVLGIHRGHRDLRHRREAGRVELLCQRVQLFQVLDERLGVAADEDLVRDAPEADGRVVVVLRDELGHLADGVVVRFLGLHEHADERDLRPQHHAGAVAQRVEVLVVLVVRQTDGVRAHLTDQREVLLVVGAADGPALVEAVLMAGHAVQRVAAAVENEALVGVDGERAEAELGVDTVDRLAAAHDGQARGVDGGVRRAVPQLGVFHARPEHGVLCGIRRTARGLGAVFAEQHALDDIARLRVHRERVDAHAAVPGVRRDEHAGRAGFHEVEVRLIHFDERHVAVQAAEEREVRLLGIDVGGDVVHLDAHLAAAGVHRVRHVHAERGEAALVAAELLAVGVHGGDVVRALELQIAAGARFGLGQCDAVRARAAVVVGAAVLTVEIVPGVGKRDALPVSALGVFREQGGGDGRECSHGIGSFSSPKGRTRAPDRSS